MSHNRKSCLRSAKPQQKQSIMANIIDPTNIPDDLSSKIDLILNTMVKIQTDITDVKTQTDKIGCITKRVDDNRRYINTLQQENKRTNL